MEEALLGTVVLLMIVAVLLTVALLAEGGGIEGFEFTFEVVGLLVAFDLIIVADDFGAGGAILLTPLLTNGGAAVRAFI